jgi:hypothetical protein
MIFGGVPYVLSTSALSLTGAGIPLAFGLTYAVEGQSAYEDAIDSGATDWGDYRCDERSD